MKLPDELRISCNLISAADLITLRKECPLVAASESRAGPVKLTEDAEHHKMEHRLQILSEYEENNETRRFHYVEVEQLGEVFHEEYYELAMNTLKRDRFGE